MKGYTVLNSGGTSLKRLEYASHSKLWTVASLLPCTILASLDLSTKRLNISFGSGGMTSALENNTLTEYFQYVQKRFTKALRRRGFKGLVFKNKLSDSFSFQLGYVTKKGNSKRWIEQEADLASMYSQFELGDKITISVMKSEMMLPTRHQDQENGSEMIANELGDKHGERWNIRQYLLLARMYVNNQWSSLDQEPDIPLSRGGIKSQTHKKETLSEVVAGAAAAFAKAITPQRVSSPSKSSTMQTGVSPASKAKLTT